MTPRERKLRGILRRTDRTLYSSSQNRLAQRARKRIRTALRRAQKRESQALIEEQRHGHD